MTGDMIRRIRRKAMLTQEEFATEIGVKQWSVAQWETDKQEPSMKNQRKIVEFAKNRNIDIDKIKGE